MVSVSVVIVDLVVVVVVALLVLAWWCSQPELGATLSCSWSSRWLLSLSVTVHEPHEGDVLGQRRLYTHILK